MDIGAVGLDVVISVFSGILGAIGAYIKLKSSIDVLVQKDINQQKEINELQEGKKEMSKLLHKRIDILKSELTILQMEVTKDIIICKL